MAGDWILIDGKRIDRLEFEARYATAAAQEWEKVAVSDLRSTPLCLICGASVTRAGGTAYASAAGALCAPCFDRFVGPSTPP